MKTLLLIWCGLLLQGFNVVKPEPKGKVFLSKDEGESWVRADTGLPADASITAWTLLSDIVVAGTENDGMYISFDRLRTWRHVYEGLPADIRIRSLATHKGMIFVGSDHGVYVSQDAGSTWKRSSDGLGDGSVRALHALNGKLFAGTTLGIYRSYNDGRSWSPVVNGIQINDFASTNNVLFATTNFGALRSTDGGTVWSTLLEKEGLFTLYANQDMVSSMVSWGDLYTCPVHSDHWSRLAAEFNNGYSFCITPVSGPLLTTRWRNTFKSLREGRPFRRDGLPEDVPFTRILVTPFGVLIGAGGGGC